MTKAVTSHVVLRIELLGIEPLVWRRVRVPARFTLRELHGVIQLVMGWQDRHLHEFRVGGTRYGVTDRIDLEVPDGMEEESVCALGGISAVGVGEFEYVYDYGDEWIHRVVLEPATRLRVSGASPLCLSGENACPPEDVGGPPGYVTMRYALADAAHSQHGTYVDWTGGVWDPKGFDLNRVNRELMEWVARARQGVR